MSAGSLSLGIKRTGRGIDYPTVPSVEIKERLGLYLSSPSGPSRSVPRWNLLTSHKFSHIFVPEALQNFLND
jgi:hypothetical protein